MQRSTRTLRVMVGVNLDGDAGYGVPGSPQWNWLWIMNLEDDSLYQFVMEIGVEKTIEAFEWRQLET